jgi:predicted ATPase
MLARFIQQCSSSSETRAKCFSTQDRPEILQQDTERHLLLAG